MPHLLFDQLIASNPDIADVEDLFFDLKALFDNPFDEAIDEAISSRQCTYIVQLDPVLN